MECLGNVGRDAAALSSLLLTLDELPEPGKLCDDSRFMLFPPFCPRSQLRVPEREGCAVICRVSLVFTSSLESCQRQGENIFNQEPFGNPYGKTVPEDWWGGGEGR